jgi:hypothetical protein
MCRMGSNTGLQRLRHWQSDTLTIRLDLILLAKFLLSNLCLYQLRALIFIGKNLTSRPVLRIRCFLDPWIQDRKKSRSGMKISEHISKSLEKIFGLRCIRDLFDPES